jgi:hypothetical protein
MKVIVHVQNRIIHKEVRRSTPFELLYGKRPNVSHLRIFGCKAYPFVFDQRQKKLDDKTSEGVFIGYDENSAAYRVYIPRERKICKSIYVIFDEESEPAQVNPFNWEESMNHFSDYDLMKEIGSGSEIEGEDVGQGEGGIGSLGNERVESAPISAVSSLESLSPSVSSGQSSSSLVSQLQSPSSSQASSSQSSSSQSSSQSRSQSSSSVPSASLLPLVQQTYTSVGEGTSPDLFTSAGALNSGQEIEEVAVQEGEIGRVLRENKRVNYRNLNKYGSVFSVHGNDEDFITPKTYREALSGDLSDLWLEAITCELNSINGYDTGKICYDHVPPDIILTTKWVFTIKKDAHGRFLKCKARFGCPWISTGRRKRFQ